MSKQHDDNQRQQLISSLICKIHQLDLTLLRQLLFVVNCLSVGVEVAELRLLQCQQECDRLNAQVNSLKESFARITEAQIKRHDR